MVQERRIPLGIEQFQKKEQWGTRFIRRENRLSLPLKVINKAFEFQPNGTSIDIVGLDNITNLIQITSRASELGFEKIRVYEPDHDWSRLLGSYLEHIVGLPKTEHRGSTQFLMKRVTDFFYADTQPQRCDLQQNSFIFEVFPSAYEEVRGKIPGSPAITFVDKTFLHALDPVKLLEALKIGDPERLIVIAGYKQAYTPHRTQGGKNLHGVAKGDLNDGFWYPGIMPPNDLLLNQAATPLFTNDYGEIFAGVHKRAIQSMWGGKAVYHVDSVNNPLDVTIDRTVSLRGKAKQRPQRLPITGDKEHELTDHVWFNPKDEKDKTSHDSLTVDKATPHSQKILLAPYSMQEIIVRGEDINPYRISSRLPTRFYQTLRRKE